MKQIFYVALFHLALRNFGFVTLFLLSRIYPDITIISDQGNDRTNISSGQEANARTHTRTNCLAFFFFLMPRVKKERKKKADDERERKRKKKDERLSVINSITFFLSKMHMQVQCM